MNPVLWTSEGKNLCSGVSCKVQNFPQLQSEVYQQDALRTILLWTPESSYLRIHSSEI